MVRTLLLIDRERDEQESGVQSLLAHLTATNAVHVTTTTSADRLRQLGDFDVVIARTSRGPLTDEQEAQLKEFVQRGGGLICLGETAESWHKNVTLQEMLGLSSGQRTVTTELIAQVGPDHDITRRLDASFSIVDSCYLLETAPGDAELLLTGSWHFSTLPLAYLRRWGAGYVCYSSLGAMDETLAHPVFQQLIFRTVRYLAGWREPAPLRVAMIGYGAIGFEHGTAMRATPGLDYVLACDRKPERLATAREAFPELRTTMEISDITSDSAIDAVIVCTPPNTHAEVALQMLQAGKHVVVEKPFSITTAEADTLIATAAEQQRTLTVYQNRRWDSDFLAIQETVRAGAIGEVFHIETFIGEFKHPCSYWHSHEPISGGVFYDWGSHYLDWVLTLMPQQVADVRASAHKRVWHDVTNADQANLAIRFEGGQEATFIHSDVAAILKPKWYILGTRGAIVANWRHEAVTSRKWSGDLIEEPLAPSEALPVVTVATRAASGQIHEQVLSLPPAPLHPFHRNLANHLLAGELLAIAPLSSRRNIEVMEAAAYSAAHDSRIVRIHGD